MTAEAAIKNCGRWRASFLCDIGPPITITITKTEALRLARLHKLPLSDSAQDGTGWVATTGGPGRHLRTAWLYFNT